VEADIDVHLRREGARRARVLHKDHALLMSPVPTDEGDRSLVSASDRPKSSALMMIIYFVSRHQALPVMHRSQY
jgi:hypothetical protein